MATHSHGYEMRLQTARELRREERARELATQAGRRARMDACDALQHALNTIDRLPAILAAYEATGDHDHDDSPLAPGAPCPGGDCLVSNARRIIAVIAAC